MQLANGMRTFTKHPTNKFWSFLNDQVREQPLFAAFNERMKPKLEFSNGVPL